LWPQGVPLPHPRGVAHRLACDLQGPGQVPNRLRPLRPPRRRPRMDRQPQASQGAPGRDPCPDRRPDPHPYPGQEAQGRPALTIGPILARTLRHFFPDFNAWLDELPDPRHPDRTVYEARFLLWTALMLFVCKLGSRRQIDYQFGEAGTQVLANLNRLAG